MEKTISPSDALAQLRVSPEMAPDILKSVSEFDKPLVTEVWKRHKKLAPSLIGSLPSHLAAHLASMAESELLFNFRSPGERDAGEAQQLSHEVIRNAAAVPIEGDALRRFIQPTDATVALLTESLDDDVASDVKERAAQTILITYPLAIVDEEYANKIVDNLSSHAQIEEISTSYVAPPETRQRALKRYLTLAPARALVFIKRRGLEAQAGLSDDTDFLSYVDGLSPEEKNDVLDCMTLSDTHRMLVLSSFESVRGTVLEGIGRSENADDQELTLAEKEEIKLGKVDWIRRQEEIRPLLAILSQTHRMEDALLVARHSPFLSKELINKVLEHSDELIYNLFENPELSNTQHAYVHKKAEEIIVRSREPRAVSAAVKVLKESQGELSFRDGVHDPVHPSEKVTARLGNLATTTEDEQLKEDSSDVVINASNHVFTGFELNTIVSSATPKALRASLVSKTTREDQKTIALAALINKAPLVAQGLLNLQPDLWDYTKITDQELAKKVQEKYKEENSQKSALG